MVLVSVQSVEDNNGYQFQNDFSESLIIDPKSKISLINIQFERRSDFVILAGGNAFQVQVGSNVNSKDTIAIPPATYTAITLSQAIEDALNLAYHNTGHNFSVDFNFKAKRFEIKDNFILHPIPSDIIISYKNTDVTGGSARVESATAVGLLANGVLQFGSGGAGDGITTGTTNYVISDQKIETTFVPSINYGGSYVEFLLNISGPIPTPGAGKKNGILFGLSYPFVATEEPLSATVDGGLNEDISWLEGCGLLFWRDESANPHLDIIEEGVSIGDVNKYDLADGDIFRITLSPDNGKFGYPVYEYKRHGGVYEKFSTQGSIQSFGIDDWGDQILHPVVGCDFNLNATANPQVTAEITTAGKSNVKPVAITAGDNNQRLSNHKLEVDSHANSVGVFTRDVAGGYIGKNTTEGFISQKLDAGAYSQLEFKLAYQTGGDFYVSVIDEEKRLANQVAEGNDPTDMGISDSYGNTAKAPSDAFATETAPAFNPALVTFRFKSWIWNGIVDNTADYRIYVMNDINQYNEDGVGAVEKEFIDCDAGDLFDWSASPDALFIIKVIASNNTAVVSVSPSGDKTDIINLYTHPLANVDLTGIKTVDTLATTSAFSDSENKVLFSVGRNLGKFGMIEADTDGAGNITATDLAMVCAGSGYTAGVDYQIMEIDQNDGTRVGTGVGTVRVASFTDYNHTTNMGAEFNSNKTTQGYCYHLVFGNPDVADATGISTATDVRLLTETGGDMNTWTAVYPRFEPTFGETIGFGKTRYILNATNDVITSDKDPVPNQQTIHNPTIMVNVDNLPIKSYIGKRFKASALITDKPVGNVQGLTKMIGKVPRHHDDDGTGGSINTGPYYYDYFPYSVPLHNASELVLNELDISVRNPDGTLATDIVETHLLLDISNVDSVGEGLTGGHIANPRSAGSGYDKLDITKGQLQPEIRGGFAQGKEGLKDSDTADQWGHGHLGANKSHAI